MAVVHLPKLDGNSAPFRLSIHIVFSNICYANEPYRVLAAVSPKLERSAYIMPEVNHGGGSGTVTRTPVVNLHLRNGETLQPGLQFSPTFGRANRYIPNELIPFEVKSMGRVVGTGREQCIYERQKKHRSSILLVNRYARILSGENHIVTPAFDSGGQEAIQKLMEKIRIVRLLIPLVYIGVDLLDERTC